MAEKNTGFGDGFSIRLAEAIDELTRERGFKVSTRQLASELDLSEGSIRNYFNGSIPQSDIAVRIAELTKVDLKWLLTGHGTPKALSVGGDESDLVLVKQLDVAASAGSGLMVYSEHEVGEIAFDRRWLTSLGVNPANVRIIQASGDSMEPLIHHADLLMVDTAVKSVGLPGIYVLNLDGLVVVKQAGRSIKGIITVESRNPAYASQRETFTDADEKPLQVAGKVVWFGRAIG